MGRTEAHALQRHPSRPEGLRSIRRQKRAILLPHDFHNNPLVPLSIKLGIKYPLPRPQMRTAGNGHYDLMMDQQRFEMRVAVVFTRVMMFVVLAKRRQIFQPLVDVLNQAAFVVVDVDTGRDVHG